MTMTAATARATAEQSKRKPLDSVLTDIYKASQKGGFEMWYYKEMPTELRIALTDLGYEVGETSWDSREGDHMTLIKW